MLYDTFVLSDIGCYRQVNEDCIKYFKPGDEQALLNYGHLAVVADGMGGHSGGQVASQLAVDVVSQVYFTEARGNPIEALKTSFMRANKAIHEAAAAESGLQGMGTTCTALVIKNGHACFAHVGDSRLYRLSGGQIERLTEDHSLVETMVKTGLITEGEARAHPERYVITRALGTSVVVDVSTSQRAIPVQTGDAYILCSDGLHDLVDDEEIRQLTHTLPPHVACSQLATLAKERGGYDNISVGMLSVRAGTSTVKRAPVTREVQVKVI